MAVCPALDVSSYGDTMEEAKNAFEEALEIFIEETVDRGTLEKELLRMGWTLSAKEYRPPPMAKKMWQGKEQENRIVRMPTVSTNQGSKHSHNMGELSSIHGQPETPRMPCS
ncbi:MAG: hypothetical protein UZ07_CHB004002639 [Chlorobi bacterium OLB7]|nr:MAG: hypothetical protein UZ07_CHB004002639 [Chlorobi bacterium OLB7]